MLIGLGHPRCGTGFTASLLQANGVAVKHVMSLAWWYDICFDENPEIALSAFCGGSADRGDALPPRVRGLRLRLVMVWRIAPECGQEFEPAVPDVALPFGATAACCHQPAPRGADA